MDTENPEGLELLLESRVESRDRGPEIKRD